MTPFEDLLPPTVGLGGTQCAPCFGLGLPSPQAEIVTGPNNVQAMRALWGFKLPCGLGSLPLELGRHRLVMQVSIIVGPAVVGSTGPDLSEGLSRGAKELQGERFSNVMLRLFLLDLLGDGT